MKPESRAVFLTLLFTTVGESFECVIVVLNKTLDCCYVANKLQGRDETRVSCHAKPFKPHPDINANLLNERFSCKQQSPSRSNAFQLH